MRLNASCGGTTVRYDLQRSSMAGIMGVLEELDVIVDTIGHVPTLGEDFTGEGPPSLPRSTI